MTSKKIFFSFFIILFLYLTGIDNNLKAFNSSKAQGSPYFSFAFLTDIHIAKDAPSIKDLEACIADINNNNDIRFVIVNGDVTEFGADKEIFLAKSILDKLNKPYYVVAGNHDAKWSESGCNTFSRVFGYEHFNFDCEGIKFIGTNSGPNMRMAPALLPRESMVWLDSLINSMQPSQPVIFVNHYPMDSSMLNYFQVLDKLKKINTQLVLTGHWHSDRAMDYEGIPGLIGRSTMRTGRDGSGYNIITINGSLITAKERIAPQEIVLDGDRKVIKGITKSPWHSLRMSRGVPFDNSIQYQHPDYKVNEQYPNVKEIWRVEDKSDIGAGAVMSGNIVVYANTAGIVYALNAKTGAKLWSFSCGGKIFSTPAISAGIIVIGCTDGNIYALNINSGKQIWKFPCDKSVLGSPAIYGGKVFIGASDNRFRALNLKTGRLIWNYDKVKGFIEAKPYVDSKQVVIGDWANMLYSFNPTTGKIQWTWTNNKGRMYSPAAVWPVKANNKIFIVTPERITYAIGAETGYQIWKAKGGRESIGLSPDEDQVYIKTMKDTLIAFNAKGTIPTKAWEKNIGTGYDIAPTPITSVSGVGKNGKGLLFVPTDKGNIIALNCIDGSIAWKHRVSFALINYIQPIGKDRILVSAMDGVVTLLEY